MMIPTAHHSLIIARHHQSSAAASTIRVITQRRSITTAAKSISTSLSTVRSGCSSPQTSTSALHLAFSISDVSSSLTYCDVTTTTCTTKATTLGLLAAYSLFANLVYLARRANLRPNLTIRELWKIRTTREEGVSRLLFGGMIVAWQVLVMIFPIVEPCLRFLGRRPLVHHKKKNKPQPQPSSSSLTLSYPQNNNNTDHQPGGWTIFFYSYPKAQGCGYILEPLACQHLGYKQRAKEQIRFDWHNFKYNVGPIGRDGFRHPPTVERNLPHVDIPRYQMRHWPWRRKQYNKMMILNDDDDEEEED